MDQNHQILDDMMTEHQRVAILQYMWIRIIRSLMTWWLRSEPVPESSYTSICGSDPWSPRRLSLSSFLRLAGCVLVCHTSTCTDNETTCTLWYTLVHSGTLLVHSVQLLCINVHTKDKRLTTNLIQTTSLHQLPSQSVSRTFVKSVNQKMTRRQFRLLHVPN